MVYLTHPVLLALIALPLVIYYLLPSGKRSETPIRVPTIPLLKRKVRRGSRSVFISAFLTFAALVLAAARPVQTLPELEVRTSGHNFVLAVDLSASMTLGDMQSDDGSEISRIDAVKAALARFISLRPDDRIALEAFGDHAYMMSPLTSDHELLLNFVKELEPGLAGALSSTGEAISLGVTTLARQTSGGKGVIILVSDGRDTVGATPPAAAAGFAKSRGITVHTVGLGSAGGQDSGNSLDEGDLRDAAYITGGKYFRATSADLLSTIYGNLSGIEASDSGDHYYTPTEELYWIPLLAALLLGFLTAALIRWHHG